MIENGITKPNDLLISSIKTILNGGALDGKLAASLKKTAKDWQQDLGFLVEFALEDYFSELDDPPAEEQNWMKFVKDKLELIVKTLTETGCIRAESIDINSVTAHLIYKLRARDWRSVAVHLRSKQPGEYQGQTWNLKQPELSPTDLEQADLGQSLARLNQMAEHVSAAVIGSEEAIKLALVSLLANKHFLMVGLPGEAKSMFARTLLDCLEGKSYHHTFTPSTTAEEVVGLPDMRLMREVSRWSRVPAGLPEANYAFLDEFTRAQTKGLLSAMLGILNERVLSEGVNQFETPLMWAIAATNYVVMDEVMDAILDRFPFRVAVGEVNDSFAIFRAQTRYEKGKAGVAILADQDKVRINDVLYLRQVISGNTSTAIVLPPHIQYLANGLAKRIQLSDERGICLRRVSTRTAVILPDILRINAMLSGRRIVDLSDLAAAKHVLVPGIMGDLEKEPEFFAGVKEARASFDVALNTTLQQLAEKQAISPNYPVVLDLLLTCSQLIDARLEVSAQQRQTLKKLVPNWRDKSTLTVDDLIELMNSPVISDLTRTDQEARKFARAVSQQLIDSGLK